MVVGLQAPASCYCVAECIGLRRQGCGFDVQHRYFITPCFQLLSVIVLLLTPALLHCVVVDDSRVSS
jgi:hypothetical protein